MPLASIAPGVGPELSSFWGKLTQHLVDLNIWLGPQEVQGPYLKTLSMLTALQKLELYGSHPLDETSGETFTLKLPHLLSLYLSAPWQGELVLSCPKLMQAEFSKASFLHIMVEDAALDDLVFTHCNKLHVAMARDPLYNLKLLIVQKCSEVGGRLIEEVSQMMCLQTLVYDNFPEACMPTSFPISLQEVFLNPLSWSSNLPKGLKGIQELRVFSFGIQSEFSCDQVQWDITVPLAELLPLGSLEYLKLGSEVHIRTCRGARLEDRLKGRRPYMIFATRSFFPWWNPWYYKTGSFVEPNPFRDYMSQAG